MYSLRKSYRQFLRATKSGHALLQVTDTVTNRKRYINEIYDDRSVYIITSGIINTIWQAWNDFWRTYWLTYIYGGENFRGRIPRNTIGLTNAVGARVKEESAFYILLDSIGRGRYYRRGIVPFYQEPTWGDIDLIQRISVQHPVPGTLVLSAYSVFGNSAKHLQYVRNASIHLSKESLKTLTNVIPSYRIVKIKYPTDIIFVEELGTRKIAINSWIEEIVAFMELVSNWS